MSETIHGLKKWQPLQYRCASRTPTAARPQLQSIQGKGPGAEWPGKPVLCVMGRQHVAVSVHQLGGSQGPHREKERPK